MKNYIIIAFLLLGLTACKTTKTYKKNTHHKHQVKPKSKQEQIVANAKTYLGTKYKYGGTSSKGMDCSGLIYTAYKKEQINLPRVSTAMAQEGKKIALSKTKKGDLVFFSTGKHYKINHVGMVTENSKGVVRFIHASSSRGVIISSMDEKYYKKRFVKAKRILK